MYARRATYAIDLRREVGEIIRIGVIKSAFGEMKDDFQRTEIED